MKIYKVTLILMTFLMVLSYSPIQAQDNESDDIIDTTIVDAAVDMKGALNGSITGDGGKTLAGAVVNLSGGETDQQLATTANGWYQFVGVEPGEYQLTITAEGYEPETTDVSIESGDTNKVNIKLRAKGVN